MVYLNLKIKNKSLSIDYKRALDAIILDKNKKQMVQKFNLKTNFKNKTYDLVDGHINFSALVNKFISDLKNKSFVYIIVNIKLLNNGYVSVGSRFPLNPKNKNDLLNFIDYLENKYLVLENRYKVDLALNVTFGYIRVKEDFYSKTKNILMSTDKVTKSLENIDFRNEIPGNLPLNTYYYTWGNIITWLESDVQKISNLIFDLGNNINRYLIVKKIDKLNSLIEVKSNNSNLKLEIICDKIINSLTNDFIRQIGDKFYHIKNNKVYFIFERLLLKSEYITKSKTASKFILNILTLDIETYLNKANKMDLYCLSFYDGNKSHSFYITNYNSTKDLMSDVLSLLLSREYSQKTVYIHNSSDFDLMFILKYLINFKNVKVEPIIKDGKFINLKIKYGPSNSYFLNFKDSFLLLPVGLSKLAKQFKVSTLKSYFPHKYVTKNNLKYIGPVPSYSYFYDISLEDYNNYCLNFNNNWDLKKEAKKYCEIDCIALYQVIESFSNLIYKQFKVNVSSVSTLPSLAFKIFRANYLSKNFKLPILIGKVYNDISQAYYGGHVDMYIPSNPKGEYVYHYDVNSLYPFSMKEFIYPTNIKAYFRGDITKMETYKELFSKYLSVLKVKVTAPQNLTHPILPLKLENTSIYPTGMWTGWYYGEELKNAIKYGYQFEILEGYLFEGSDIFSNYVDVMYVLKENSPPDSPMYIISKLLMNSLYGRFGMSPNILRHEVINNSKVAKFISKVGLNSISEQLILGGKTIIAYRENFPQIPKINVSIASAITANARVIMSNFKNKEDYTLYYSDTDSYFLNKPLPANLVHSKKLGKFKLEKVLSKFIALGPKTYGGIDINGEEFTKIKGLKSPITVSQLEGLLNKDNNLNVEQEKWFNLVKDSTIAVKISSYNLKPTNGKRDLIFKGKTLVATKNKNIKNK